MTGGGYCNFMHLKHISRDLKREVKKLMYSEGNLIGGRKRKSWLYKAYLRRVSVPLRKRKRRTERRRGQSQTVEREGSIREEILEGRQARREELPLPNGM